MTTELTQHNETTALDAYVETLELPPYAVPFEASTTYPMIRFAKGVTVVSGKSPKKYTGWHIAIEQSLELDALFEGMGVLCVRVKHLSGNEESYWQLDSIKGYLLCKAVPQGYGPDVWQKTGVAHIWNEHKDTYGYGSQLQCLFFMKGLVDLGYTTPLVLSFSRTVTEHFIRNVLRRQEILLESVKRALRKHGKPDALASYAFWVELVKAEEEAATKGGGSYFPPATSIPSPITIDYVKDHQAVPQHLAIIEEFLPQWDTWAQSSSTALLEPPRDNAPLEEATEEKASLQVVADDGIKATSKELRKAASFARQKLIDLGFTHEDWDTLLNDLGITVFSSGKHIADVNAHIKKLMNDIKAS